MSQFLTTEIFISKAKFIHGDKYNSYFHKTCNDFEEQRMRDKNKITLAQSKCIPLLEFNYKQFKHLSKEQFEDLIINTINRKTRN